MKKTNADIKPDIFDRVLSKKRQERARKYGDARDIYARVGLDIVERLGEVKRDFNNVLVIAPAGLAKAICDLLKKPQRKLTIGIIEEKTHGVKLLNTAGEELAACSFDLVINGLELHYTNKVPEVLRRLKAVLQEDGLFLAVFIGGRTLNQLRQAMYEAEDNLYGRISPRIAPMISLEQAAHLLQASGLALPVADRDVLNIKYSSLDSLYQDLRRLGQTNILLKRSLQPVSKRFFHAVEQAYERHYLDASGKYMCTVELIWLTAWAPHPDQPKPLKPGSAQISLADVLNKNAR